MVGLFLEVTVNANSKEIHPMCRLDLIFDPDELKTLNSNDKKILKKLGISKIQTSPGIRKIIRNDRTIQGKLKRLLKRKFNQLTRT